MIDNRVVGNCVCGGGNSGVAGECVLVVIALLLVVVRVKRRMLMILSYWVQFLHQAFDLGATTKITGNDQDYREIFFHNKQDREPSLHRSRILGDSADLDKAEH